MKWDGIYLRQKLSHRATCFFINKLEETTGMTYLETGWSTPFAFLASLIDRIGRWKRDAEKYYKIKEVLKETIE